MQTQIMDGRIDNWVNMIQNEGFELVGLGTDGCDMYVSAKSGWRSSLRNQNLEQWSVYDFPSPWACSATHYPAGTPLGGEADLQLIFLLDWNEIRSHFKLSIKALKDWETLMKRFWDTPEERIDSGEGYAIYFIDDAGTFDDFERCVLRMCRFLGLEISVTQQHGRGKHAIYIRSKDDARRLANALIHSEETFGPQRFQHWRWTN